MDASKKDHFFTVLRGFSRAMLTTRGRDGGLHTRPMVIGDVDKDGNIWLLTGGNSEKVEELAEDRQRIHALFKEPWKVYFPKGAEDPNIVLIKVNSVHGEYWDNAGLSKMKYLWEVAKAYASGTSPKIDKDISGKVQLDA
jgi:general stress protein 26